METISNNNSNRQLEKVCKNECGKLIRWDKSQNAYIEIDTNHRHKCPNWNPKQEQRPVNPNCKITQEQQLYVDTIGPAVLEIRSAVQDIKQLLRQQLSTEQ